MTTTATTYDRRSPLQPKSTGVIVNARWITREGIAVHHRVICESIEAAMDEVRLYKRSGIDAEIAR